MTLTACVGILHTGTSDVSGIATPAFGGNTDVVRNQSRLESGIKPLSEVSGFAVFLLRV